MLPPPEASRSSRLETGRCAPVPEAVTAAAGYPFRVPREPLIAALGGCPADHEELSPTRLRFAQRATKLGQFPLPADEETAGRGDRLRPASPATTLTQRSGCRQASGWCGAGRARLRRRRGAAAGRREPRRRFLPSQLGSEEHLQQFFTLSSDDLSCRDGPRRLGVMAWAERRLVSDSAILQHAIGTRSAPRCWGRREHGRQTLPGWETARQFSRWSRPARPSRSTAS